MDFYKVLKYSLMVAFAAIIVVGALMATDEPSATVQQPVPQQSGSKFNF